jgi:hypothetical protein
VKENLIATRLRFGSLKEDAKALNSNKNVTWVLSFTSFFFSVSSCRMRCRDSKLYALTR